MPDGGNPYLTVNSPSYAAPLMDWQGLLNPQQRQQQRQPGQPQPGAPGQPGQPGQPNQAQQQMQGLGAWLQQRFGLGGSQPGAPMNIVPPGAGMSTPAAGPMPLTPQGNPGLY